ncbi:hypothetical protein OHB44_33105 (plasmid) [Micromonospora sp. NBC_00821]|uniref:hypothetical protein n=1 Tax=Micromonospora sp. NBC_00821 TaxID=2975977 RepID=UPI002ED5D41E|nr:hypothetical protein OHB44_33105 [Micromonospora sp. NBC_00821]
MSTPARRSTSRNTRAYTVEESTIRQRCATADAAEYTLYVRSLITNYVNGGQAQILRTAKIRRLAFPGLNRQKLSEHLNGRYRHGPSWDITELIIGCLPDSCDTASIRAFAAGWYQCARRQLPDGYDGPVSRPPGKSGLRNVPESEPAVPVLQRKIARLQDRLKEETLRHLDNLRASENGRNQEFRRANQLETQFHQTRNELLRIKTVAAEVATIREEYARQCVALELVTAPALRAKPVIDLPPLPTERRRIRFGHLVATIDPQAPPARRALARYLCVYAEFAGVSPTELAARIELPTTVTADILAARFLPTTAHLASLTAVLDCHPDTARHLATVAGGTTALDESFWNIAATVDAPLAPLDWTGPTEFVGIGSDNRSPRPHTAPTAPIADRLQQLADLHQRKLIGDDELAEQRARILGEL